MTPDDDLIEQLRQRMLSCPIGSTDALLLGEAADVLAQCRAENERLLDYYEQQGCDATYKENRALRDANESLRAEVEQHKALEAEYYPQDLRAEVERQRQTIMELNYQVKNSDAADAALRARVAELEAALATAASIAEGDDQPSDRYDGTGPEYWAGRAAAADAIRAALNGENKP